MSPFAWASNPSPPEPSRDDCSDAERRAWRKAAKLTEQNPAKRYHVWKSQGEFIVLQAGERGPSRARDLGEWMP